MNMKNILTAYVLAIIGLITPVAGLHRFYLNKKISGFFYLCTYGFFTIGTIIDLIRMPSLLDEYNLKLLFNKKNLPDPQKEILQIAYNNQGVVTTALISLNSHMNLNDAKTNLEKLYKEGFCKKDIDEDGVEIYLFLGLSPKKPLF